MMRQTIKSNKKRGTRRPPSIDYSTGGSATLTGRHIPFLGLPPFFAFSRQAWVLRSDLTIPPLRPRAEAEAEMSSSGNRSPHLGHFIFFIYASSPGASPPGGVRCEMLQSPKIREFISAFNDFTDENLIRDYGVRSSRASERGKNLCLFACGGGKNRLTHAIFITAQKFNRDSFVLSRCAFSCDLHFVPLSPRHADRSAVESLVKSPSRQIIVHYRACKSNENRKTGDPENTLRSDKPSRCPSQRKPCIPEQTICHFGYPERLSLLEILPCRDPFCPSGRLDSQFVTGAKQTLHLGQGNDPEKTIATQDDGTCLNHPATKTFSISERVEFCYHRRSPFGLSYIPSPALLPGVLSCFVGCSRSVRLRPLRSPVLPSPRSGLPCLWGGDSRLSMTLSPLYSANGMPSG